MQHIGRNLDRRHHVAWVVALACSVIVGAQAPDRAAAARERYKAALEEFRTVGSRGPAFKAFLDQLPKVAGLYVVEGDMLMNEDEVFQNYLTVQVAQGSVIPGPELKMNVLPTGELDRYDAAHRTLTYAIDRRTFANDTSYQSIVTNMASAAKAWEEACPTCGLKLTHVRAQDAAPAPATVNFVVRNFDAGGAYIAAAFFPHDGPSRRFLNIDPSYHSTTFDKVGVLRHELGHVIGYRHEHIEGIPGCYVEDSRWIALTPYDRRSVMHYLCGGAGSEALKLTVTDIEGHRKAYRKP